VSLKDAWTLMRLEKIKALPVVDADRQVVGIVTVADFMRLANLDLHEGLGQRPRALVKGRRGQPASMGEIMSHPVQVARVGQHAMDLMPLFSQGGHHHIPIVDGGGHLVGIITQTDLVRTLALAVQARSRGADAGCRGAAPLRHSRHRQVWVHRGTIDRLWTALCLSIDTDLPLTV